MSEPRELPGFRAPAWLPAAGTAALVVGFVVISFVQRWNVLNASPFPLGVDGYFYPVQLRSLLETGELQYAASPMAFWLLAPFAAATDPITGAKLGAAFYGALVAVPAYAVGVRLGTSRACGLVAAALVTFSAGSAYLTIEFVKNGIGITVALFALWLVLRAAERPARGRLAAAIAIVVVALLTHKMAAAIVVGIAVPSVIAEAIARGALRGRRLLQLIGAIAVAVIALVIAGLVAPQRFVSIADAQALADLFTLDGDYALPVLDTPRGTLWLGYEPIVAGSLATLAAAGLVAEHYVLRRADAAVRPSVVVASWFAVVLALLIALPWITVADSQGLGMRLRVVAFVPMALCAAIVVRLAFAFVMPHVPRARLARWIAATAIIAGVLVWRLPASRTEGRVLAHPALVSAATALAGRIPAGDVAIIPERHIAFMVAWYTRIAISIRPDPIAIERRWRVMPLAFIGMGSALDDALMAVRARTELPPPIGLHSRHPNGFVLVPEVTWQYVLARLPVSDRAHFSVWPAI